MSFSISDESQGNGMPANEQHGGNAIGTATFHKLFYNVYTTPYFFCKGNDYFVFENMKMPFGQRFCVFL